MTSVCQLMKRRKRMQTCLAATATGSLPERSVTCQPLSVIIQSMNAPTADGSDWSIDIPET